MVGSMTVASPVSGRFGAVGVDGILDQHVTGLFLTKEFALAIVESRHRRSCNQQLADFSEPGTKWALLLTQMTFIKAPGSRAHTYHELSKVDRSGSVLTGVVLQDRGLVAVMRSIVEYGRTLE